MCDFDMLLRRIEKLRNKMTTIALDKGLTSVESIAISQELDRLLNIYDEKKHKELKHRQRRNRRFCK